MHLGQTARRSRRAILKLGLMTAAGSVLAACSSSAPPQAAKPAEAPAKPAEAAKPAEPAKPAAEQPKAAAPAAAKVTTMSWITPAEVGLERDFFTSFYQDFEKANPNIKVQVSFESFAEYPLKLATIMAGGSIPDLIFQNSTTIHEYGARGVLRDLNPYLQRDKIPADLYFKPLMRQLQDYKTYTKQWAIPKDSGTFGVYYNKDMFDKASVPYPKKDWTFAEFRETAKKLTFDKNGKPATSPDFDPGAVAQWGLAWGDGPLPTSNSWQGLVYGVAGPWFNDDFTKAFFDTPEQIDLIQQLADMRCKDRSIPGAGDSTGQGDPWRNGLTAMTIGHQSQAFFYNAEKKTFKYDIAMFPGGKNGQVTTVSCSAYAIPVKAQNPDAAWELLKFLTSEPVQCKITDAKRWASSVTNCQDKLIPADGNPPGLKAIIVDPLMGRSSAKTTPTLVPPFLNEMRQVFRTELDGVFNCGGVNAAEACKKVQTQVMELLDKAAKLS
ncbi:MAG: sugar ABC transporter substrate-binding protein [Chloroflexota bacterium]